LSLKKLTQNTLIYTIGNISLRASAFLLIPIYTHFLSKSEFGLLQTLLFTIQIMITLVDVGIRTAMVRFVKEYEDDNKLNLLLGSSLIINLTSGIILFFLSVTLLKPVIHSLIPDLNSNVIIILTSLAAISQTFLLNIISFYRAKNEGKLFMSASLLAAILLLLFNSLFLIILKMGINGALWAQVISYGILWIGFSIAIYSKTGIKFSSNVISKLLVFGAPLILAMSGDLLLNTFGVYFLGYFRNLETVATYTLSFKIAQITLIVLIIPFQLAYEPFVYSNLKNPELKSNISKITTYLMLFFTVLAFLIVFTFRDLLTIIVGSKYEDSYRFIYFILPGFAFMGLQYIGQSLLHINNKTKITGITIAVMTVIGIILNYILIDYLGMIGIIITFNLVMAVTSILLIYFGNKEFKINFENSRLLVISLIFLALMGTSYYLNEFSSFVYYSVNLILFLMLSLGIYFSNFFDRNEKDFISNLTFANIINKKVRV